MIEQRIVQITDRNIIMKFNQKVNNKRKLETVLVYIDCDDLCNINLALPRAIFYLGLRNIITILKLPLF